MTDDKDIADLRGKIDQIDDSLLALINERARKAMKVGNKKPGQKADIVYRPEREAQILQRLQQANSGPLESVVVERLFREIISACRAIEAKPSIATLGPDGTFSELATRKQFGAEINLELTSSIEEVFRLVEAEHCDIGVVPVEEAVQVGFPEDLQPLWAVVLVVHVSIEFNGSGVEDAAGGRGLDLRQGRRKTRHQGEVDLVVFRENTEGLFVNVGGFFKQGTKDEVALQEEIHTYTGVERVLRAAFSCAGRGRWGPPTDSAELPNVPVRSPAALFGIHGAPHGNL